MAQRDRTNPAPPKGSHGRPHADTGRDPASRPADALPERGPSSLLPPDARLAVRKAGPEIVPVSPSTLLPDAHAPRPADPDGRLPRHGPSSLLPQDARHPVRPAGPEIVPVSPSSLLPKANVPRPPGIADAALPEVGPSSLLPATQGGPQWREAGPEIVAVSPSALLPQAPDGKAATPGPLPEIGPSSLLSASERGRPVEPVGPEVVAVSPSELLPPVAPASRFARRSVWALVGVVAVAVLSLVAVVVAQRLGPGAQELAKMANAEIAAGDYPAAIVHLREAVRKAPGIAETRYGLGAALLQVGDATGAEQELRRAVDLGLPAQQATLALGRALLLQGKYEMLLQEFTPAGVTREQLPDMLTLIGSAHLGLDRVFLARERLTQALQLDPQHAGAQLAMARLALHNGNRGEAAARVEKVLARDAKNVEALAMQAELYQSEGDIGRARKAYHDVLAVSPNQITALLGLVGIEIREQRFAAAETLLRAATKVHPASAQLAQLYGLLQFRRGRLDDARKQVQRALQIAPSHLPSMVLIAAIEFAAGSHSEAQRRLTGVLERNPFDLTARRMHGASLLRSGQPVRAVERLESGLQIATEDPTVLSILGQAYAQIGEYAAAVTALDAAERHAARGTASQQGHGPNPDPATTLLEEALELDSKQAGEIKRAAALYVRGNLTGGEQVLAQALAQAPNDTRLLNLRAAFAIARKDFATAQSDLQRALALDPEYVPAAANMARIDLVETTARAARRRVEAIHQRNPRNIDALLALAQLGESIEADPAEIERWLLDAMRIDPKLVRPRIALGHHYLRRNEPARALEQFAAARQLRADNAEVLDGLARAHTALGQDAQARAALAALALLRPDSAAVLRRLALAQLEGGQRASAEMLLGKALELAPDSIETRIALARLELASGKVTMALDVARRLLAAPVPATQQTDIDDGIALLQQAVGVAAARHEVRYQLARLYLLKGDRGQARSVLEQLVAAAKGSPEQAQAAELLGKLGP